MKENKRNVQKELTRKKLIEVAIKLFGDNGILNTKTIDISKEAGVSHGTVFSHFRTQEELLDTVIEEVGDRIVSKLQELIDVKGSLEEILKAHINGLIEFEKFYTRLIIERRLLPESASNIYVIIQSSISFHIGEVLKEEIAKGKIIDTPIHLLFNSWVGLIHYYLTNGDLFTNDGSILNNYGQDLINHYIKLIKVKKG
ncbi:TetR/AcrR family transcriptional regulator [Clostridium intestinale]|uniref:Transcriptional regulator, TetR family n=1 Tax=Clostridium intestinale DSM 6191 TaxID=1121320 RepID=A0A1M6CNX2_9CLOT|nr:TetR/AcrR family transcriptional regulator [Clostridium intestinale]SHI62680.1 transcriptional regulator, TetR family [Clostridium intestinale DSM 6191]